MKKLFSILALVLFAGIARAANPSFNAFDANFFQVTGTGNGSIKIKTNAFTWLNAGGGESVWTNSNGTISNTVSSTVSNLVFSSSVLTDSAIPLAAFGNAGTNVAYFNALGSLSFGRGTPNYYSNPGANKIVTFSDTAIGESGNWEMFLAGGDSGSTTNHYFNVYGDSGSATLTLDSDRSSTPTFKVSIDASGQELILFNRAANVDLFMSPSAADGTTPYTLDTSAPHTSGNLLEVKNAGVETMEVTALGGQAGGFVSGTSTITATAEGSLAWGNAVFGGKIRASGVGSVAGGLASDDFGSPADTVSTEGLVSFVWGHHVQNSASYAFVYGKNFSNSIPNSFTLGWGPATVQITQGLLKPMTSNAFDIGTPLLPIRTNYAKAFTVVGSQRTVAYSESGTIYLDADAIRLRGVLPLNTNLVIPLVATLNITNGLIMAVTGP